MSRAASGLQVAIELATRRRDAAAAQLSQARAQHNGAQAQLDQLHVYAGETEARWAAQARVNASPELMHHHYQFMGRLYQALDMQRGVVQQHERRVLGCIAGLREAELRLGSLQKVVARQHSEAIRQEARRDQKDADEFASQQLRRMALARQEGTQP